MICLLIMIKADIICNSRITVQTIWGKDSNKLLNANPNECCEGKGSRVDENIEVGEVLFQGVL